MYTVLYTYNNDMCDNLVQTSHNNSKSMVLHNKLLNTFCFCVLRSHMKTPPAVGNSPLRSELELPRPVIPGRVN